jgi:hypothetical protein
VLVIFNFSPNFFLFFDHLLSWQRGIVYLRRSLGTMHRAIAFLFYDTLDLMWRLVNKGKVVDSPKAAMRG